MALQRDGGSRWPKQVQRVERQADYLARDILPPAEDWMEFGACVGRWPMWDRTIEGEALPARKARQEQAARICRTACPVFAQCRQWSDRAARIGDFGVCAGRVVRGAVSGRNPGHWIELGEGGFEAQAS